MFVGDVVGDPGVAFLERHLPALVERWRPQAVVVNAENASVTGPYSVTGFGLSERDLERLLALGVDAITTGNHAWDGKEYPRVLEHERVLRPINHPAGGLGRGALIVRKPGLALGVINVAGRSAIPFADRPLEAVEAQLAEWEGAVDAVVVDHHSGSSVEKEILAVCLDGRVAAVVGTHEHVPTADAHVMPGGTAYITDVGMVGPTGGVSGVDAQYFREWYANRLPPARPYRLADGPVRLGAVRIELDGARATGIHPLSVEEER